MTTARTRKTASARPAKKAAARPKPDETGAEILGRIRPKRRVESTTVCLNASLIREFQEADAELARLMNQSAGNSNRLNPGASIEAAEKSDDTALRTQARKVRRLEQAVVDAQVEFTFTSLNKDEFAGLTSDHPPRRTDRLDQIVGYHRDEVVDALVRASLTSPVFEDCLNEDGTPNVDCDHEECGTWQQLISVINPAEWGELRDCSNLTNSGVADAPKSLLASRILDRLASA